MVMHLKDDQVIHLYKDGLSIKQAMENEQVKA